MRDAYKPFWIGAAAGAAVAVVLAPLVFLLWKAAANDRAAIQGQIAEISQRLETNNQALGEMQKTASLAGVTQQLMELNGRIKSANEALAELQKTSAGIQRGSLDKIADRIDRMDASLKANADAVTALQKSAPLVNLSKQLGQLQANFAAFNVEVAELKQRPAETAKRLDALDASLQALGARVDEIKRSLETAAASPVPPALAPAPTPTQTPPRLRPRT